MHLNPRPASCDLLSFYYLCRTRNNKNYLIFPNLSVVICFHFTIFVVLGTTGYDQAHGAYPL